MINIKDIKEFGKRIGKEFDVEKVILFGSYAQGTAVEDSDVDLLIVSNNQGSNIDQSVQIRLKLHPPFPVDLIVKTPEKIRQRLEIGDQFIRDIILKGKVLYEADKQ